MKPHASAMSLPGLRVPAKNCGCEPVSTLCEKTRVVYQRKQAKGIAHVQFSHIGLKEPTKHSARCASYSSYRRVLVKKSHIKNYFRIKGYHSEGVLTFE